MHWGLASVPGFAQRELDVTQVLRRRWHDFMAYSPYAEWYENAMKLPGSLVAEHHRATYGNRPYEAFREDFERGLAHWNPDAWAEAFADAGARYVVMVTKHHDGYCLWPSRVRHPRRSRWACSRDLVGELAAAVRARGLRFGVYYSGGIDWSFEERPVRTMSEFLVSQPGGAYADYAAAQVRELIERVRPDMLWNDISWPGTGADLVRLFTDYYAAVPDGVVNDRWTTREAVRLLGWRPVRWAFDAVTRLRLRGGRTLPPPPVLHADVRIMEYEVHPKAQHRPWECVRGMDKSFGYNRTSEEEDFLSRADLLGCLDDVVAKNGNLLINVGPRGEDGVIPAPQMARLRWLGEHMRARAD